MPGLFDIDAASIPDDQIPTAIAALAALQTALVARLMTTTSSQEDGEALLNIEQAARKLCVTEDWLYRRAKKLGLAVKLGDGTLRFSTHAINAYIRQQAIRPAPTRRRKLQVDKADSFIS
jgi:hypothetical protein